VRLASSAGALLATLCLGSSVADAQNVSGHVFEDRNANGILDPGEPLLPGVTVELFGQSDSSGAVDVSSATGPLGQFGFSPGDGCYLLRPLDPAGWRPSVTRFDRVVRAPFPGDPTHPVGEPRFGRLQYGLDHLRAGSLRYTAMGDSIATNFNFCELANLFGSFRYSLRLRDRMNCTTSGTPVTLDQAAVKGEHTDDLLVDDGANLNNVFSVIGIQPEMISISMIGNDLLDVDRDNPTQAETNTAVAEILDARQNLQEVLSSMLSEIPDVDVTLNTLYDNLSFDCYGGTATSAFHREWIPIIGQLLRDLAWGQVRPVTINEVAAEFVAEDQNGACAGFDQQICTAGSDGIHPVQEGYDVIAEKLWEAAAGVNLGTRDALGRGSIDPADYGYLRRVRRILPTAWETRDGATVVDPAAALDDDDGGATASIGLGGGTEEFRLSGFPSFYDEIRILKVIAGVRYRTSGTFAEQLYRIEASPGGQFRPGPGFDYTTTNWNFSTPIVGAGGPSAPVEKPDYPDAALLVTPNVTAPREVSATLTGNPVLQPGAGEYEWPALTHVDLATTAVRVVAATVGADPGVSARVELDAAWLDLYGWEKSRPAEVAELRVDRLADGTLETSFDEVAGAQRYNLYTGRLPTARQGAYDHGSGAPAGPDCAAATEPAGAGRAMIVTDTAAVPAGDLYLLATAHVDDVESPTGFGVGGGEIDRSQSVCP
jgi:lysophospholipase L1-like esterase